MDTCPECGKPVSELLTRRGEIMLVNTCDLPVASGFTWRGHKYPHSRTLYAVTTVSSHGKKAILSLHRLLVYGRDYKGKPELDHKNRNGLDNRRCCNLRPCTHGQNSANREKVVVRERDFPQSKYKGVHPHVTVRGGEFVWDGRWTVFAPHSGKPTNLGTYLTEEEAARVYDADAYQRFGEFAFLNFPLTGDIPKRHFLVHRSDSTTGFRGVCVDRRYLSTKPYFAYISHEHRRTYLGSFALAAEAAEAYDEAAIRLHGEHARLNFPRG